MCWRNLKKEGYYWIFNVYFEKYGRIILKLYENGKFWIKIWNIKEDRFGILSVYILSFSRSEKIEEK